MFKLSMFIASVLLSAVPATAPAAVFLSGDSNIFTAGNGQLPTSNQQFFKNIAGGDRVLVQDSLGFPGTAASIASFYNGAGFSSSVLGSSASITTAALAGVNLFITFFPDDGFSPNESTALASFVAAGHNLLAAGENSLPQYATINSNLNALMATVGSDMRIVSGPLVNGYQTAQLKGPSSFLNGVEGFQYAAASTVTGGLPLFGTVGENLTFIAVTAVPEPATYGLMLVGVGAVLGFSSRKPKFQRVG